MINIFFKKKIITKLIIVTILVIHFSCYVSLAAEVSADQWTYLTNNIRAWKNIDSADIVLANGQDISNLAVTRKVEIQEQEEEIIQKNKLDLCLILDCSSSMKKEIGDTTKIDTLKFTAKKLLENLSNNFQLRVTIINFGVHVNKSEVGVNAFRVKVPNDSGKYYGGYKLVELESDMEVVADIIENLKPEGNTPTVEAIEFANKCWDSIPAIESVTRKTVLITDGMPTLNSEEDNYKGKVPGVIRDFKQKHSDIQFITLLVGKELKSIVNLFGNGDKVMLASDENFEEAITDNLYNEISSEILVAGEEKITKKEGFFETEDGYNAIADEEIIYGATLTVDYSIHINSNEKLNNINITDYIPEGMQVVSASYTGSYNPNDNTVTFENIPPEEKETVIYLTLSKVLTSAEDIQEMENTADITVTTAKGETYTTIPDNPYATEKQKYDARVHSKKLSIIPPFGSSDEEQHVSIIDQIINHWKIISLAIIWIMVAIYFIIQIKRRK